MASKPLCLFMDRKTVMSKQPAALKMNFFIKDFFNKCDQNLQFPANLVIFTEETLNGKLHFLSSDLC